MEGWGNNVRKFLYSEKEEMTFSNVLIIQAIQQKKYQGSGQIKREKVSKNDSYWLFTLIVTIKNSLGLDSKNLKVQRLGCLHFEVSQLYLFVQKT